MTTQNAPAGARARRQSGCSGRALMRQPCRPSRPASAAGIADAAADGAAVRAGLSGLGCVTA